MHAGEINRLCFVLYTWRVPCLFCVLVGLSPAAFSAPYRGTGSNGTQAVRGDGGALGAGRTDGRRAAAQPKIGRAGSMTCRGRNPAEADPLNVEGLMFDLRGQREDPDITNGLGDRPIDGIVAAICRDMGKVD